jgi:murein DD-endopeptidase MepM/ murein hydrolase activator NlpD
MERSVRIIEGGHSSVISRRVMLCDRFNRFITSLSGTTAFRPLLTGILCGILCLCLPSGAIAQSVIAQSVIAQSVIAQSVIAQSEVDVLQQQRQQVQQQRQQVQQQREYLKRLEKSASDDLSGLQKRLKSTQASLETQEAALKTAKATLSNLEVALTATETSYRKQQSAMVTRLQFLQRQRDRQGLAVLLKSSNLNELLDKRYQLKRLYESDRKSLTKLQQQTEKLARDRLEVETQKNQISLIMQQLLAQKNEAQAQADYQKEFISHLKNNRQALESAISQLEKDSTSITQLIRQRSAGDRRGIVITGNGAISLPVDGEITSLFGYRMHPILGYQKFHSGIDFGADSGTTIRAGAAGVVIYADWYGGYGNTVIVDHGGGITTLYAHSEGFYITNGQQVQKGQPIAAVGSTGLSTGPHLHFEVRQAGEPIDPAPFL